METAAEETVPSAAAAVPARESLTPAETRVLGSLLEKERLTPDNYPLTLNGLVASCNQSTNRDPVMTLGDREVEESLDSLRRKKLATVVFAAGARVQKYRHNLHEIYTFTPHENALLCVLLLRGPQTVGELRSRAERMAVFDSLPEVEACLENLAQGSEPLVRLLPARPGQKERRYVQLLSGEPVIEDAPMGPASPRRASAEQPPSPSRLEALETEIAALRAQLEAMREEFALFKRQFE
jgi:uncharacterized protein YceH (UPF0502 family)